MGESRSRKNQRTVEPTGEVFGDTNSCIEVVIHLNANYGTASSNTPDVDEVKDLSNVGIWRYKLLTRQTLMK